MLFIEQPYIGMVNNGLLLLAMCYAYELLPFSWRRDRSPLQKVALGTIISAIGVCTMLYPWQFMPGVFFDTRSVLLGISGLFFGTLPTLFVTTATSALRLYQGGTGTLTGVGVIVLSSTIGLLLRRKLHGTPETLSWAELYFFGLTIHVGMLLMMLTLPLEIALKVLSNISLPVMLIYPTVTMLLGKMLQARTNLRKYDEALKLSEEQYRTYVNNSPLGLLVSDREGNLIAANPKALNMYGGTLEELRQKNIIDIVAEDRRDEAMEKLEEIVREGRAHFELPHKTRQGAMRWWEVSAVRLGEDRVMGYISDVTEQRETRFSLTQKEQEYRSLFDSMLDGFATHEIILDDEGNPVDYRIISLNPAYERLTGLNKAQILGKRIRDVLPNLESVWIETYGKVAVTGEPVRFERYSSPLGKFFEIYAFSPKPNHFACVFHDTTERVKAESALKSRQRELDRFFTLSLDALAILDSDGTIRRLNPAWESLLGHTLESMTSSNMRDFVHPEDRTTYSSALKRLAEGQMFEALECRFLCADQSTRWLAIRFGAAEGLIYNVGHDITQRMETEKILREAKDAAVSANKAKSAFLANMSHEIRTPLNGIVGMLQLLRLTELNEEQKQYADTALGSSNRLTTLLSDILDLSMIEAGKMNIVPRIFSIAELQQAVEELFQLPARQKGISLSIQVDEDMPEFLIGDSSRLGQVLFNLVGNAVKFTHEGGVSVVLTTSPEHDEEHIRLDITVRDTGIGIANELQDDIFEAFSQVESTASRSYQGAGLGLAIVKRLVGIMNGEIRLESTPGRGTAFYVSIPLSLAGQNQPSLHGLSVEELSDKPAPLSILVAEDDRVNRETLKGLLQKDGHSVTAVCNGQEAVDAIRKKDFDLFLIDVQMPIMNGEELIGLIKKDQDFHRWRGIPAVAVTAHAMQKDEDRLLRMGFNGYLPKPVDLPALQQLIKKFVYDKQYC